MLYTPLTKKAMQLCFEAHSGQVDKCGIPYVNHPLHLAEQMRTEEETCAALLHDVMEDCGKTPSDLRSIGVSERVLEALMLLTHADGTPYLDYIENLKGNEIARKVKIADLRHNSNLARLDVVTGKDLARLRKYMEARVVLGDMAYELETPVGPVSVEVNGDPYPFLLVDRSHDGWLLYEEDEQYAEELGRDPASGRADICYGLSIDITPLSVGDVVRVVYDFGDRIVDQGAGQNLMYCVYAKGGYTVGVSVYDDDSNVSPCEHAYRLRDLEGTYEIVADPVTHQYGNPLDACVAWKEGATEADAEIVGWAVWWL